MSPNQTIAAELRDFAQRFVNNRAREIQRAGLLNTEDLLRSLDAKVNVQPERDIYFMTVYARAYGRYQDMRRRYDSAGGTEMEKLLMDWAEREGISKFMKGKYAKRYKGQSDERILGAIAWGYMKNLPKRKGTKKRGWWNRGKTFDIDNFYDILLRAYSEAVAIEMKTAFA